MRRLQYQKIRSVQKFLSGHFLGESLGLFHRRTVSNIQQSTEQTINLIKCVNVYRKSYSRIYKIATF